MLLLKIEIKTLEWKIDLKHGGIRKLTSARNLAIDFGSSRKSCDSSWPDRSDGRQ